MASISRIVALVDMDCFYAQVEQRLNPALKGKPVAVVQYKKWKGGGIIAVNYEARDFGVTRNMRGDEAKAKCPDIALVRVPENRDKADISKYREAGREVIDVLCQFSSCVERASIDEAYLDLTEAVEQRLLANPVMPKLEKLETTYVVGYESDNEKEKGEEGRQAGVSAWLEEAAGEEQDSRLACAAQLVEEMRAAVFAQTGFTCSAGIAHNKPLSKLVCGLHKPNRQTVLPQSKVAHLYATLPVRKVRSLGGKLGENLVATLGITVMADLEKFSEAELCQKFDQNGSWLYNIARGIDNDPVNARLIPKSIGCCKRFPGRTALGTQQEVEHWIGELAKEVSERLNKDLEENHRQARGLTVQWSFKIGGSSSSKTGSLGSYEAGSLAAEALQLLAKAAPATSSVWNPPLQFLGVFVGKFSEEENKSTSIAKFFKPMEKIDNTTTKVLNIHKNEVTNLPQCSSKDDDSKNIQSKAPTDIKSFFLNYTKKSETKVTEVETELEESFNRSLSSSEENSNDVPCPDEKHANPDDDKNIDSSCSEVQEDRDEEREASPPIPEDLEAAGSSFEVDPSVEAPCPQCGVLVSLAAMSEHLDLHVAQELHRELNAGPLPTPRPPLAVQPVKKRKYTKSAAKNTSTKKTRGIDSFFSHK